MTITYPLTLPSSPDPFSITLTPQASLARNTNPYNFNEQAYDYGGGRWIIQITYPPLTKAQARNVQGFLCALLDSSGTFQAGDPKADLPSGVGTGTPLVNGGSQTGKSLITDGWTAGVTGILLRGDMFQLENYLYIVTKDVNSDGSGNATLDIWPHLRSSPANNAALTLASPKSLFRLDDKQFAGWSVSVEEVYAITFTGIEAVP